MVVAQEREKTRSLRNNIDGRLVPIQVMACGHSLGMCCDSRWPYCQNDSNKRARSAPPIPMTMNSMHAGYLSFPEIPEISRSSTVEAPDRLAVLGEYEWGAAWKSTPWTVHAHDMSESKGAPKSR
jgi:hypothetical protein